ncbi:MAG: type VI secretion system baseplate subunit TssF [Burkholderiales bacterium]
MDPTLLRYYNRELQFMREMGGEFAKEFPKVAGRLGLEGLECADPYVERLLEGFSFLAARIQMRIDAEFPRFSQHLFELVYPNYLAPTPSMAIVQLRPDLTEGSLAAGFTLKRETALQSILGKGDQTPCEYRTAHDVTLWPIEIAEARYFTFTGEMPGVDLSGITGIKSGLRLRLRTTAGLTFNKTALASLCLYLRGSDDTPMQLQERLLGNAVGVVVRGGKAVPGDYEWLPARSIRPVGFEDDEALLPFVSRSFQGYRLLQEYFALPQRFLFVELTGLGPAVRRCNEKELEITVLFDRSDASLERVVDAENFALFCTPVINLVHKRADRIHLTNQQAEYHLVPDRTRPMDLEVYQVTGAVGYGTSADAEQVFQPFHSATDWSEPERGRAYYQVRRVPRILSERQRRLGPRSSYVGSEVFISLVDAAEAPLRSDLRQLGVTALCTNRDLPLSMPLGVGKTDFTIEESAPVNSIRCIAGPSKPAATHTDGDTAWRLISHLSLNYLSLADTDDRQGASALRELLTLYAGLGDAAVRRQIEGVRSVTTQPVTRRMPMPGPVTYGRGLQITLTLDETAFEGTGVFLLGAVLERFFARYVSINGFTETIVRSSGRGEIMRWPPRLGQCQTL